MLLFLIASYHIQCILSLEGNLLMEKFSKFLPKELHTKSFIDKYDAVDIMMVDPLELAAATSEFPSQAKELAPILKKNFNSEKFAELCAHSSALVLLLRLKRFLLRKYNVTKTRLSEFVPNQKEKVVDRGINVPDNRIKFDGVIEESRKENGSRNLDVLIRQYAEFHELQREEECASAEQTEDFTDDKLSSRKRRIHTSQDGPEIVKDENNDMLLDEDILDQYEDNYDY